MKNTTINPHRFKLPPPIFTPKMSQFLTSVDVRAYVRTFFNITCSFNFAGISDSIKHPTRTAGGFRWGKTEQAN